MKQNWASILGNVEISSNKITLLPPAPSPLEMSPVAQALVRSDIHFEQGTISMDVKLPDPDARCCIGISVERGGELFAGINTSIVIADITPNNPNVFYEVGYAHGIGKNTILLSDRKREQLPFDVSGFRTLFYENTIAGKGEVEARLRKHLEVIAT